MGIRIELVELLGEMEVVEFRYDEWWSKRLYIDHAEFKAACCRDLGLVDPDEQVRKFSDRMAANHAADVLAAASRRLA